MEYDLHYLRLLKTKKRMQQGVRLSQARESTLDYRLGLKGAAAEQVRRPNPATLKGWASLVEDRIEVRRLWLDLRMNT